MITNREEVKALCGECFALGISGLSPCGRVFGRKSDTTTGNGENPLDTTGHFAAALRADDLIEIEDRKRTASKSSGFAQIELEIGTEVSKMNQENQKIGSEEVQHGADGRLLVAVGKKTKSGQIFFNRREIARALGYEAVNIGKYGVFAFNWKDLPAKKNKLQEASEAPEQEALV